MINLNKCVQKYNEGCLNKLVSSDIVTTFIEHSTPSPACVGVYAELIAAVSDSSTSNHLLQHIGLLNLYAELCKSCTEPSACNGVISGETAGIELMLRLLCKKNDDAIAAIMACFSGGKMGQKNNIFEIFDTKYGDFKLRNTVFGQLLCMHLVRSFLKIYESHARYSEKLALNPIIVSLLRVVFNNPDRAHMVYASYYGLSEGGHDTDTLFHALYGSELSVLEEFRSRSVKNRLKVSRFVRDHVINGSDENSSKSDLGKLPDDISGELNWIIHGSQEVTTEIASPRPKMTRLAQLTCFIRKISDTKQDDYRRYSNHLEGIHYRRAEIVDAGGCWTWKQYDESKRLRFANAVDKVYNTGHPVSFFDNIFDGDAEAWIQDGEVTFLWLCAIVAKLDSKGICDKWLKGESISDLKNILVTLNDFAIEDDSTITNVNIFDECFKNELCLIGTDEKATPKFMALVNFLLRVQVAGSPKYYKDSSGHFQQLLESIELSSADSNNPKEFIIRVCEAIKNASITFEHLITSRFPTFYLECILRSGDASPYTLFFHPITFDHDSNGTAVPGVFLAGTFQGLEAGDLPSCTIRQNYHKNSILDAIRPIIDFEIGRVLQSDRSAYAGREVAEVQAKLFRKIQPEIEKLSALFGDAQSRALRIRSVIDPDWSGLFSHEMYRVMEKVFNVRETERFCLKFVEPRTSKKIDLNIAFAPQHNLVTCAEGLCHLLLFIMHQYVGDRCICVNGSVVNMVSAASNGKEWELLLKAFQEVENWKRDDGESVLSGNDFFLAYFKFAGTAVDIPGYKMSSALLKVLTVDSMASDRGVYLLQLAMMVKLGKHSMALGQVCYDGDKEIPLRPIGDISEWKELLSLKEDWQTIGETSSLSLRYDLKGDVTPAAFLKAVRSLCVSALNVGAASSLARIVATQLHVLGSTIVVLIRCRNHFGPALKNAVWNYMLTGDDQYHDLRTNVKVLVDAIGTPPDFTSREMKFEDYLSQIDNERVEPFAFINFQNDISAIQIVLPTLMKGKLA